MGRSFQVIAAIMARPFYDPKNRLIVKRYEALKLVDQAQAAAKASENNPYYYKNLYRIIKETGKYPDGREATKEEKWLAESGWVERTSFVLDELQIAATILFAYQAYNQYYGATKVGFVSPEKFEAALKTSQPNVVRSYSREVLNDLERTNKLGDHTVSHIFDGDLNRRGKAVGYHYGMIEDSAGSGILGSRVELGNDIYKVKVEVNSVPKTANGGYSTMFPDTMSPQEVVDAINEAYYKRVKVTNTRNTYRGTSNSGLQIDMFIDKDGKIISAFPTEIGE